MLPNFGICCRELRGLKVTSFPQFLLFLSNEIPQQTCIFTQIQFNSIQFKSIQINSNQETFWDNQYFYGWKIVFSQAAQVHKTRPIWKGIHTQNCIHSICLQTFPLIDQSSELHQAIESSPKTIGVMAQNLCFRSLIDPHMHT